MSILKVANVQSNNATSDLTITSGNTSGAGIKLYSNNSGFAIFSNSSNVVLSADATSNVLLNNSAVGGIKSIVNFSNTNIILSGNVTPTILTTDVVAWDPDPSDIAFTIRVQANSTSNTSNTAYGPEYEPTIFGLTAGTNGQIYTISNIGSQKIQIRNEDTVTETTAGNRFNLPNHLWLYGYQSIQVIYDGTLARWRPINVIGANPINSLGYDYDGIVTTRYFFKSPNKSFFTGGITTGCSVVATADRTTYSSETTAAVSGANLNSTRFRAAGSGNEIKGFFAGGQTITPSAVLATADKTTFSSESTAAISGANLSQARASTAGAGNADKGFFSGGTTATTASVVATTDRTTYSTEATAAVSGANLSQSRYRLSASGNADKGFFMGGAGPAPLFPLSSVADRTTYSTETTAAVTGANLGTAKSSMGSLGNSDKGFFAGGLTTPSSGAPSVATSERTIYSTETTASVSGTNLSSVKSWLMAASGNPDKGFFAGGQNPTPGYFATADKTTYSTETTTAVTGANLSQVRAQGGAI